MLRCILKSLSLKIKNAATKDQESELMVKAWYAEHISWASGWAMMSIFPQVASQSSGPAHVSRAITANSGSHMQTAKGSGKKGKDKDSSKGAKRESDAPGPAFKSPRLDNSTPSFAELTRSNDEKQSVVDKMFKLHPEESRTYWREYCRNCFLAGKGNVKHSFFDCQKMGNPCVMRCAKCKQGNHWISQCTA